METAGRSRRKILYTILAIVSIPVILLAALFAYVTYVNWSSERRATAFCGEIEIGSDVSRVVDKAKSRSIFYGSDANSYTFYFFGFVFDKAVCDVSVTADGKVKSKAAEMEYD
jgi:hypothetical protein